MKLVCIVCKKEIDKDESWLILLDSNGETFNYFCSFEDLCFWCKER